MIVKVHQSYPQDYVVRCDHCGRVKWLRRADTSVKASRILISSGWKELYRGWVCDKCLPWLVKDNLTKPEVPGEIILKAVLPDSTPL